MRFGNTTTEQMGSGKTGNFGFSGVRAAHLTATSYTLVSAVVDITGSTAAFASDLQKAVLAAIDSCFKSPRADNLLFRYVHFHNHDVAEIHGFLPLKTLVKQDYDQPKPTGMTNLMDAAWASIGAANAYGKTLSDEGYNVNAVTFIITDGEDNSSKMTSSEIKRELERGVASEEIESHLTILVGINSAQCQHYLDAFFKAAGLSQFVPVDQADEQSLAKLSGFISRSISSQSQSLGTGGPSQPLSF